ncbi:MAG: hypothetical protein COB02_06255 [Candidatus Cloacimonadota bacterium]|nr:MAG: hypothetical protein COB02_06255 [Candidatus Cloacimonadota bacterium]
MNYFKIIQLFLILSFVSKCVALDDLENAIGDSNYKGCFRLIIPQGTPIAKERSYQLTMEPHQGGLGCGYLLGKSIKSHPEYSIWVTACEEKYVKNWKDKGKTENTISISGSKDEIYIKERKDFHTKIVFTTPGPSHEPYQWLYRVAYTASTQKAREIIVCTGGGQPSSYEDSTAEHNSSKSEGRNNGKPSCGCRLCPKETNSPFYLNRNEFFIESIDLSVNSGPFSINISRKFLSKSKENGPFGEGWAMNHIVYGIPTIQSQNQADGFTVYMYDTKFLFNKKYSDGCFYKPESCNENHYTFINAYGGKEELRRSGDNLVFTDNTGGFWTLFPSSQDPDLFLVKESKSGLIIYKYNYDEQNKIIRIYAPNDLISVNFIYNEFSKLSQITDNYNRSVNYFYDNNNNLTSVQDPLLYTETYAYEDPYDTHNLTHQYNKNNKLNLEASYDSNDKVSSFKEYGVSVDIVLSQGQIVDTKGDKVILIKKNSNGQVLEKWVDNEIVRKDVFDLQSRLILTSNENGSGVAYKYDKYNRVIKTVRLNPFELLLPDTSLYESKIQTSLIKLSQMGTEMKDICQCIFNLNKPGICAPIEDFEELKNKQEYRCEVPNDFTSDSLIIRDYVLRSKTIEQNKQDLDENAKCDNDKGYRYLTVGQLESLLYDALGKPLNRAKSYFSSTLDDENQTNCFYFESTDLPGDITEYSYSNIKSKVPFVTKLPFGKESKKYYQNNLLVKEISSDESSITYDRNKYGQIKSTKDETGKILSLNKYNSSFLLSETINQQGQSSYYYYDNYNFLSQTIDSDGNITDYENDILGRVIKTTYPSDENQNRLEVTNTYDGEGQITETKDYLNRVTSYNYDDYGHQTKVTRPDGLFQTFLYDEDRLIEETDILGRLTKYTYNHFDQRTSVTNTIGETTNYIYDKTGRLLQTIDSNGNSNFNEYDFFGRLKNTTDQEGRVTSYDYNPLDQIINTYDSNNILTQNIYNENGRLSSKFFGNNDPLQWDYYYEQGQLVETVDPNGKSSSTIYDEFGRVDIAINAEDEKVKTLYDLDGKQIGFENNLGRAWTKDFYPSSGRLSKNIDALNNETSFEYDEVGRLKKQIYSIGNYKELDYNDLDQVTQARYFNKLSELEDSIDFSYDSIGNLLSLTSSDMSIFRKYDDLNRLIEIENSSLNNTIIYEYDSNSNRSSQMLLNTLDQSFTLTLYEYNRTNQLKTLTENGKETRFEYTQGGNVDRIIYPNGIIRENSYDDYNRLNAIIYKVGQTTIQSFTYTLDNNGNKLSETLLNGDSTSYEYDSNNRLVSVDYSDGSFEDFEYDSVGNRTLWLSDNGSIYYNYNENNQLLSSDEWSFTYNNNGAMVSKTHTPTSTDTIYTYNARNKLSKVSFDDLSEVNFSYYPESDLRYSSISKSGISSYFSYDGQNEREVYSQNKVPIVTITNLPSGFDQRLYQTKNNKESYFLTDALNSVRGTKSDTATNDLDSTHNYFAYGKLKSGDPLNNLDFGFTGRVSDLETGLSYYRGRYYDTCNGIFTQVDPQQSGSNWHSYVSGNPVNFTDPTGYYIFKNKEPDKVSTMKHMQKAWVGQIIARRKIKKWLQKNQEVNEPSYRCENKKTQIDWNTYTRFKFILAKLNGTTEAQVYWTSPPKQNALALYDPNDEIVKIYLDKWNSFSTKLFSETIVHEAVHHAAHGSGNWKKGSDTSAHEEGVGSVRSQIFESLSIGQDLSDAEFLEQYYIRYIGRK